MTTVAHSRCQHCRTPYRYYRSGQASVSPLNDAHHCEDCKKVILEALACVPKRFDVAWEVVTGELAAAAIAEHDRLLENPPRVMGAVTREYRPGLWNHKTGARSTVDVVRMNHEEYIITRWSDDSEPVKVERKMERDLITGAVNVWRDFA